MIMEHDFSLRCMRIDHALRPYDKDNEYLKGSHVQTKEKHGADRWVIMGKNFDKIASFNHEPTDKEIHNAICERFGLYDKIML